MKAFIALPFALALAGCGALQDAELVVTQRVSQKTIAVAVQGADAAGTAATAYLTLPLCAAGATLISGCRPVGSGPVVGHDAAAVENAKNALWTASKAAKAAGGDGSLPATSAAYTTLTSVVKTLQGDLATK